RAVVDLVSFDRRGSSGETASRFFGADRRRVFLLALDFDIRKGVNLGKTDAWQSRRHLGSLITQLRRQTSASASSPPIRSRHFHHPAEQVSKLRSSVPVSADRDVASVSARHGRRAAGGPPVADPRDSVAIAQWAACFARCRALAQLRRSCCGRFAVSRATATTIAPTAPVTDVAHFYGISDWPNSQGTLDLGGRALTVIPTPGHDPIT